MMTQEFDKNSRTLPQENELLIPKKIKISLSQNTYTIVEDVNEDIIEKSIHFDASVHRFDLLSEK